MAYTNDTKNSAGSYTNDTENSPTTATTWAAILTTWATETQTWAEIGVVVQYANDTKN